MKITRRQLRQIIKEEASIISEQQDLIKEAPQVAADRNYKLMKEAEKDCSSVHSAAIDQAKAVVSDYIGRIPGQEDLNDAIQVSLEMLKQNQPKIP